MFTMLAQLSPITGDRPSSEATPPSGRGERRVGACFVGRTSLGGYTV